MSYCVNCGIELDKTAKRCPLCKTKVINPVKAVDLRSKTPYPKEEKESLSKADRRYAAQMVSIMFTLISVICIVLNIVYAKGRPWSAYFVSTFALFFVILVPPILKKTYAITFISVDAASILFYLFILGKIGGNSGWFYVVALPVVICAFLEFTMIYFYVVIARPSKIAVTAGIFSLIGVFLLCINASISNYFTGHILLSWSLVAFAVCFAISIALYVTRHNMYVHSEIHKRLHF